MIIFPDGYAIARALNEAQAATDIPVFASLQADVIKLKRILDGE